MENIYFLLKLINHNINHILQCEYEIDEIYTAFIDERNPIRLYDYITDLIDLVSKEYQKNEKK